MKIETPALPYSVKAGEQAFDWRKALKRAISRKQKKSPSLEEKSKSWVTCACGNQCSVIPRGHRGAPRDGILNDLGVLFFQNIEGGKFKEALVTLDRIEERSIKLIKVINALEVTKTYHANSISSLEKRIAALQDKLRKEKADRDKANRSIMDEAAKDAIYASSVGNELY